MANYSIVVNSKFRPFSYAEMMQPLISSTQAHQEVENAYGELEQKASIWENMANEQTDKETYKLYKTYANDLRKQADVLAREGLNTVSRRDMLNMRSRYNKEIVPIEQAYAARQEEAKTQYAGRAQGMVYEGDASMSSLDRYLHNPSIRYGQANSQEGFKRVSTVAAALSRELRDYGNGKRLDPYVKTWLQEHGYRDSDINSAISDIQKIVAGDTNIETNGVLRSILKDEMNVSGVSKWNDTNAKMDYFSRVAPALYQAVGQTQVATYEDYGKRLAAQESMKRRLKALDNPSPILPNTRHWEGVLKEGNFNGEVYNKLLSKLTVNGKGLNSSYAGKNKFVNPLKVYEEISKYAKEHRVTVKAKDDGIYTDLYKGSVGARVSDYVDKTYEKAVEVMKKKYGVDKVLSKEEYDALKSLGFTSSSGFTDMYSTKIADKVNRKATLHRPTSLNLAKFDYASELMIENMKRGGNIYDIDTHEKIDYSDIEDSKPTDVAFDMNHKGKLLIMINGRRVEVPALYHSPEANNIVKQYEYMIDNTDNIEEKVKLQDLASIELRNLFNSYEKSRAETSSKI